MTEIQRFSTGIPELDQILGGGIPEYSVNILAGEPGSGKTILGQQMAFTAVKEGRKVLYLTTLSEPPLKLIRYQSQFKFFDESQVSKMIFFRDIAEAIKQGGAAKGMEEIMKLVKELGPSYIFIDSFKAIEDLTKDTGEFRKFCYDLSIQLSSWEASIFFIGEYHPEDMVVRPEFAIADSIFFLSKKRKPFHGNVFEVSKMRGSNFHRGKHSFEISMEGLAFYPSPQPNFEEHDVVSLNRLSWGIPGLNEMTGGGCFEGMTTIVAGSAGVGKTILALKFLENQPGGFFSFDNKPNKLISIAKGLEIIPPEIHYFSPVNFNPGKAIHLIKKLISEKNLKRVVLDSISDVEFPISHLYDLIDFCNRNKVTTLLLKEVAKLFGSFQISGKGISILADSVIFMRYLEFEGRIDRALTILKMRGSDHTKEIRKFEIRAKEGLFIENGYGGVSGIMMGQGIHVEKDKQQLVRGELFRTLSPLGLHYFMEAAGKSADIKELFKEIDIFVHEGVLKMEVGEDLKKRIAAVTN